MECKCGHSIDLHGLGWGVCDAKDCDCTLKPSEIAAALTERVRIMQEGLEKIATEGLVEGGRVLIARRVLADVAALRSPSSQP